MNQIVIDRQLQRPYVEAMEYYRAKRKELLEYLQTQTMYAEEKSLDNIARQFMDNLNTEYIQTMDQDMSKEQGYTSDTFYKEVEYVLDNVDFTSPQLTKDLRHYLKTREDKYRKLEQKMSRAKHRSEEKIKNEARKMRQNMGEWVRKHISMVISDQVEQILSRKSAEGGSPYFRSVDKIKSSFINRVAREVAKNSLSTGRGVRKSHLIDSMIKAGDIGYNMLLKTSNELYVTNTLHNVFKDLNMTALSSGQAQRETEYSLGAEIGSDVLMFLPKYVDNLGKDIVKKLKTTLDTDDIIFGKDWDRIKTEDIKNYKLFTHKLADESVRSALSTAFGVNAKSWQEFEKMADGTTNIVDKTVLQGGLSLASKAIGYIPNNQGGRGTQPYYNNLLEAARQTIYILGVRNIIFASKNKFYFMDAFIREFREKRLLIQVKTHWDNDKGAPNKRYWVVDDPNKQELNYNKWKQVHNIGI